MTPINSILDWAAQRLAEALLGPREAMPAVASKQRKGPLAHEPRR